MISLSRHHVNQYSLFEYATRLAHVSNQFCLGSQTSIDHVDKCVKLYYELKLSLTRFLRLYSTLFSQSASHDDESAVAVGKKCLTIGFVLSPHRVIAKLKC